jgi:hypothetical protein
LRCYNKKDSIHFRNNNALQQGVYYLLKVKGYQQGDENNILALFNKIFGEKRSKDYWLWENMENPRGESIIALLKDSDDKIRGHLCLHVSLFKVGEQYLAAGQRINSMLDREFRQKGNFARMYDYIYQNSRERGISFMFGFPNKQALGALNKITDIKELGEIPRYVKFYDGSKAAKHFFSNRFIVLITGFALQGLEKLGRKKVVKDSRVFEVKAFDSRFDRLWFEASKSLDIATVRDSVYLNWRYTNSPRNYKIWACEEKDGHISGYLVLFCEDDMGHIIDLLALDYKNVIPALLGRADEYCSNRCHTLSCWCLDQGQVSTVLKNHGFLRIKSHNKIVFNSVDCTTEQENLLKNSGNWYITMGDSDYK